MVLNAKIEQVIDEVGVYPDIKKQIPLFHHKNAVTIHTPNS